MFSGANAPSAYCRTSCDTEIGVDERSKISSTLLLSDPCIKSARTSPAEPIGVGRDVEMLRQPFTGSNRKMEVWSSVPPKVIALSLLQLRRSGEVEGLSRVTKDCVRYGGKMEIMKVWLDGTTGMI